MNEHAAAHIVELMLQFGSKLNESVAIVREQADNSEYENYRSSVGNLMGTMLIEIMNPIFEKHPHLKPDQLR